MDSHNYNISVIVPVYNAEKYLHRCVDSILAQTYTDFELLLIDDGSNDGSGTICDEYASIDSRVRVFHKPNGGVSSARNLGLDNARGKWISFVDSDDWISHDYIAIMLELAEKETSDIVVCDFTVSGDVEAENVNAFDWKSDSVVSIGEYIVSGYTSVWALLARRNIFESYKLRFPEGIKYCEDLHLLFRLFYFACGISVCHMPLYYYWQHSASAVHNKNEQTDADERLVIMSLIDFSVRHGIISEIIPYLSWRYLYASIPMLRNPARFKELQSSYPGKQCHVLHCKFLSKRQKLIAWLLTGGMRFMAGMVFQVLRFMKHPV